MEASGGDRSRQAMLAYEIGRTIEDGGGGEAAAVREYLGAYNLDPSFRPPLFELVRMFERRRSFKNLARLYEAELKSATTPAEKSSALVDRASLLEDHLAQAEAAGPLFEQAAAEDPEGVAPVLMLERRARVAGDAAGALAALEGLVARTKTPALRAILMIELGRERDRAGDVDGAMEVLRDAVRASAEERPRALRALEEIARKHGRAGELVAALETRAAMSAADVDGAVALFLEGARVRLERLGDADGARATIEKALALAPDDPALRRAHMLAAESSADLAASAADAAALRALVGEDTPVASLLLREAEAAQASGDVAGARSALERALAAEPGSAVLRAMYDDLSLALGEIDGVVARLESDAAGAEAEVKATLLARAASFAAHVAGDAPRAAALYARAAEASAAPAPILREMLATGITLSHAATTQTAIARLLAVSDDAEEKAALHHARYAALVESGAGAEDVKAALEAAIEDGAAWAVTSLRIWSAADGDHDRLGRAHLALAERKMGPSGAAGTIDADTAAAHLVAAARAFARADRHDDAASALKKALERAPGHRYAVALLEEIYRRKGDADAVVRILREAAEADQTGRAREAQLLVAGAAAESAGDLALAAKTYEEALERDPKALAPLLALRALAEKRNDAALEVRALASLAEHELAAGAAGRYSLELGEHHQSADPEKAVAPLRAALETKETRAAAALDLALMGVPAGKSRTPRVEALSTLFALSMGETRVAFGHELLGEAIATRDGALGARVASLLEPEGSDTTDVMARVTATRLTAGDAARLADRARSVEALAHAMSDSPDAAAELLLHASRIELLASGADSDAVLRAADIAERAPGTLVAALAAVEALGDGDDIGERATALALWAPHASGAVQSSIEAGAARLLALAGRSEEALPLLRTLFDREPGDLASAEMLRVAARDEQSWPDVVRACDRLAEHTEGELRAQLLEEASAVLMDHLEQDEEAEPRLRSALALDPARPIAYARLHDVLADRGDEAALLALVSARIEVTDDPVDLSPLFYEQARLHRSLGDYEGAFASLENLLLLEAQHLGGLALLVELHVQREQFAEAVDALRQIATAEGVPNSQRRIARLGAADFLDKKLDDARGALTELRQIEEIGLADRALYERVATLAERLGDLDRASDALERGGEVERDPLKKAAVERRLAKLEMEQRGRREHALAAYRRAIRAQPTDLDSLRAASALISDATERRLLTEGPEAAFRAQLEKDPLDASALRALAAVADARGDRALGTAVARVLVAVGLASADERDALDDTEIVRPPSPTPALSDARFAGLSTETLVPAQSGAVGEIVLAAVETLTEADRLEPSTFGLGRGDLAKPGIPLVDEVLAIAAKLGAPAGDVWIGGSQPTLVTVIPSYKGKPAWILGANAGSLSPAERRFRVGVLAAGLRLGVGPLALRVLTGGSEEVAAQLYGTCVAAGAPLAAGEGRVAVADAARVLGKAIGRRARRTVTEAVPRVGDGGRPLLAWARALTVTLTRVGSIAAGDPAPSMAVVQREQAAAGSLDARSVARFWVADSTLALRRELGLTPSTGATGSSGATGSGGAAG